jgi:hypothetical protein
MAEKPQESAALSADDGVAIPRIAAGEIGINGLRIANDQILAEANRLFRWPNIISVVNEMDADATVSTAFNVYNMILCAVPWTFDPPKNPTKIEQERAEYVKSMMDDMDGMSWDQYIKNTATGLKYGFAVSEKVYRKRLKKNGSKFNDGLVGLRKLAPRSQDTIAKWYFSEDGRTLEAVGQSLDNLENGWRYQNLKDKNGMLRIPRNKLLIYSVDSTNDNPMGRSLLKAVFLPYKQLTLLKDQLMLGISKDLQGIPCIGVPQEWLNPRASPEQKAAAQQMIDMANNIAKGTQSGIVYPLQKDDKGDATIEIKLLEAKYGKSFDIPKVIEALQTDILTALSVDVVKLGSNSVGSYSLADSKQNLLSMAIEYRLKEIRSMLNEDLARSLYEMNGWSTDRMGTFEYGDITTTNLEELGKFIQRVVSVKGIPVTHSVVNLLLRAMGAEEIPEDEPLEKYFPKEEMQSRAGDGMSKGSGNGTSDKPSEKDNSSSNTENA